jgi:hypothetical protein
MEEGEPTDLPKKDEIRGFSTAEDEDLCRSIPIQIVRDSRPTMNVVVRQSKLSSSSAAAAVRRTVPVSPNRCCCDESDDDSSSEPVSPVIEVDLTPSPTSSQLPEVLRHAQAEAIYNSWASSALSFLVSFKPCQGLFFPTFLVYNKDITKTLRHGQALQRFSSHSLFFLCRCSN